MARQTSLTHIKPPVYLHLPNKSIYYHLCQPLLLFFPSLRSPECMFARIKQGQRLLSSSLLLKTNYSCECTPRSLSPNTLFLPLRLPSCSTEHEVKALCCPNRLQQASVGSTAERRAGRSQWLFHPSAVPFSLHSLSLMKCGGAKATLHKPSGTVCYHRQTMIKFQTGDAGVVR